jgi:hypothetical protein
MQAEAAWVGGFYPTATGMEQDAHTVFVVDVIYSPGVITAIDIHIRTKLGEPSFHVRFMQKLGRKTISHGFEIHKQYFVPLGAN